ncbi:hypothetical protein ABTX15_25055 [Micromonospora sp. NPDC094482]|uniref:hypothetical protein n=1 Tax=unclassified Micromonospora TaxID=2617518 RepID=UPI0033232302
MRAATTNQGRPHGLFAHFPYVLTLSVSLSTPRIACAVFVAAGVARSGEAPRAALECLAFLFSRNGVVHQRGK